MTDDQPAQQLPLIDGLAPLGVELQLSGKTALEPGGAHDHGDTVYLLVKGHIADVRHPERIDEGIRIGVSRLEVVKADGAWVLPKPEGRALVSLNERRTSVRRTGGQMPLPDDDLRARVIEELSHLVDGATVLFPGVPDDASELGP